MLYGTEQNKDILPFYEHTTTLFGPCFPEMAVEYLKQPQTLLRPWGFQGPIHSEGAKPAIYKHATAATTSHFSRAEFAFYMLYWYGQCSSKQV